MWKTTYRHFSCSVLVETLGSVGLRLPLTQECCGLYSANTSRHSPVRSPVTPLFAAGRSLTSLCPSVCASVWMVLSLRPARCLQRPDVPLPQASSSRWRLPLWRLEVRPPWLQLLLNAVRGAVRLLGSRWASWDPSRAPHAVDRLPHWWGPALPCLCLATAVPPAAPAQSDGALPRVPTIFRDSAGLGPLTGLSCRCSARDLHLLGLLSCPWGPSTWGWIHAGVGCEEGAPLRFPPAGDAVLRCVVGGDQKQDPRGLPRLPWGQTPRLTHRG